MGRGEREGRGVGNSGWMGRSEGWRRGVGLVKCGVCLGGRWGDG